MRFYDTLTRRKKPFEPLEPGKVRMYLCGPTVYSDPHIGNFRSFLVGDIIRRWLEYRGYQVFYVMNITDIDDKTIRDSGKEGISLKEFTERYTRSFLRGLDILNIRRATVYPRATENVPEMIEFIEKLIQKGLAYVSKDGVYYDISKFPGYGKLSGIDLSAVRTTERMLRDEYDKERPSDFALWKRSTDEEIRRGIYFESPWGRGRPGWHIECSVMSRKYLGDTLDIHAGGEDLIFPHHENEIAQSEGLTGKEFARFWIHIGFLMVGGRKMSKSLGNYISFDEVISKYSPDALRYFYISTHYRKQIDYTDEAMKSAENAIQRLGNTLENIEDTFHSSFENLDYTDREEKFLKEVVYQKMLFEESMDDDLDTPRALMSLHSISKIINEYILTKPNKGVLYKAYSIYRSLLDVLGLIESRKMKVDILNESLIDLIIQIRDRLRNQKMYEISDSIREELKKIGILLIDRPEGTVWRFEEKV
ncbi:cysteine--tRNA ligase [Candidatus Bathyarchaeota archaeon]|nr:cysteine--tRNA ligase [Candidatus Bathyarchaeota archaeon]